MREPENADVTQKSHKSGLVDPQRGAAPVEEVEAAEGAPGGVAQGHAVATTATRKAICATTVPKD